LIILLKSIILFSNIAYNLITFRLKKEQVTQIIKMDSESDAKYMQEK